MRVTIVTIGSRGDIQPYLALALGLRAAGHRVKIATHDDYESVIRAHGLDFAPIAGNPRDMMSGGEGQAWLESGGNTLQFARRMKRLAEPLIARTLTDCLNACRDADVILGSTLGILAAGFIGKKLNIPMIPAILQPTQATRTVGSSILPPAPDWLPFKGSYNLLTYTIADKLMWSMFKDGVNKAIQDLLDMPPLKKSPWIPTANDPVLYAFSEQVIPRPYDWSANAHITGFWFLDSEPGWRPPATLVDFLESGDAPVYIGFGSMSNRDPQQTTEMVIAALTRARQRGILLTGWNGMSNADLPDHIFKIDSIPHDWLFPRMAAVVHHGGMGTTAAGLRAGVPSALIPFFADQPFWGSIVHKLGVGTKPIPRQQLSVERLADAIHIAVNDEGIQQRAAALGERIRAEDGVGRAVAAFERIMLGDRVPMVS